MSEQGSWAPSPTDTPYARIGQQKVLQLAEAFYDDMEEREPALAAVHRRDEHGKVTREARDRFALFLVGWLGGPQDYTERHGHPRLRMRHAEVPVDTAMRDAWVRSMTRAMEACALPAEVQRYLQARFGEVATFLRNREG
jgi:hemoglobin